jgi:hypothetical protein
MSVFLEVLQPFAAHSIRSRVTDDMTFAQVQQEAEDAGLAGRRLPRLLYPWHCRILFLFARHWHLVLAPRSPWPTLMRLVIRLFTMTIKRLLPIGLSLRLIMILGIPFMEIYRKENRTFRSLRVIGLAAPDRLKTNRS